MISKYSWPIEVKIRFKLSKSPYYFMDILRLNLAAHHSCVSDLLVYYYYFLIVFFSLFLLFHFVDEVCSTKCESIIWPNDTRRINYSEYFVRIWIGSRWKLCDVSSSDKIAIYLVSKASCQFRHYIHENDLKIPLRPIFTYVICSVWLYHLYPSHFKSVSYIIICPCSNVMFSVFSKHLIQSKSQAVTKIYCGVDFMCSNLLYGFFWWRRSRGKSNGMRKHRMMIIIKVEN